MHIRMEFPPGNLQINVKDHNLWANDPRTRDQFKELSENTIDAIYSATQETFWLEANQICNDFGYGKVYSEGRSGGWLETSAGPRFPDGIDYNNFDEYKKFEAFARAIKKLQAEKEQEFVDELTEEVNDLNKRREAAIVRSVN